MELTKTDEVCLEVILCKVIRWKCPGTRVDFLSNINQKDILINKKVVVSEFYIFYCRVHCHNLKVVIPCNRNQGLENILKKSSLLLI